MNDRKRQTINLIIKLLVQILFHFSCSCAMLLWKAYVKFQPNISFSGIEWLVQDLLFMTVFQIFIYINYKMKKLTIVKHKVIYIITDFTLLILTFLFWCVWMLGGPIWLL